MSAKASGALASTDARRVAPSSLAVRLVRAGAANTAAAPSSPAARTVHRSHGSHCGVRSSSAYAHAPVPSIPAAATARPIAGRLDLSRAMAPTPTSAPIAGASATM